MKVTINIAILLPALLSNGFASNSNLQDSILYANTAGLNLMSDAPWVINKDDYIPFFFIIKDCNQYLGLDFYCLAIYDISDGVKYYGDEIVPDVDYTDMGYSSPPSFNYNCSIVWSMEIHKVS
jgi:hypothetical protein